MPNEAVAPRAERILTRRKLGSRRSGEYLGVRKWGTTRDARRAFRGEYRRVEADRFCGDWHIFQLRWSSLLYRRHAGCLGRGARARPSALKLLDLGAGIGSVIDGAHHHPNATLKMIEAQEISHLLARRAIERNDLQNRVRAIHADLRDLFH